MAWAKAHKDWKVEHWRKVVWSDESMIRMVTSVPRKVWKAKGEKISSDTIVKRFKSASQLMIWSMISGKGIGELYFVKDHMNSEQYTTKVIKETLVPQLKKWFPTNYSDAPNRGTQTNAKYFRYMQDKAPCHASHVSISCLEKHKIPVLDWPSNSPDCNPIENVWHGLKQEVPEMFAKLKQANERSDVKTTEKKLLELGINEVWHSSELVKRTGKGCIDSMLHRIKAVIAANGSWTKY